MMAERGADDGPARGFVPDASGARWALEGPLTFAEARAVLETAQALPLPSTGEVDLTGVGAFDSAAVAVLLALERRAAAEGATLRFSGMPGRLRALAALYAVEELLAGQ